MTTQGIRVYSTADQTGIADATHVAVLFNSVLYDTNSEWDAAANLYRPKFLVPTIVKVAAHVRWIPPSGAGVGYAKIWGHWKNDTSGLSEGFGEGVVDGPLSAANPGIGYSDQRLCQPGDYLHIAFWAFSGMNGHTIQSGVGDDITATPNRTYFAACYEA